MVASGQDWRNCGKAESYENCLRVSGIPQQLTHVTSLSEGENDKVWGGSDKMAEAREPYELRRLP